MSNKQKSSIVHPKFQNPAHKPTQNLFNMPFLKGHEGKSTPVASAQVDHPSFKSKVNQQFDLEMDLIEFQKSEQYYNFMNSLSSKNLVLSNKESFEFIDKNLSSFTDFYSKFVKLSQKDEQESTEPSSSMENRRAIRVSSNMTELLTIQILLKTVKFLMGQAMVQGQSSSIRMQDMSPIDLKLFKQLLPGRHSQHLRSHSVLQNISEEQRSEMIDEKKKPSVDSFSAANKVKTPDNEETPIPVEETEQNDGPLNHINTATLSKIAQSLSPDPTKLIQQQKAMAEQSKLVGTKRASQEADNSLEPERKR